MPGLTLGLGSGNGLYSTGRGGAVGSEYVFDSPITGDSAGLSARISDYPSVWVIGGAFIVMALVYTHWLAY